MSCESNCSKQELDQANEMRARWAANDAIRDKDLVKPEGIVEYCDLVYSDYAPYNRLNLYQPPTPSVTQNNSCGRKLPVVVAIHGGGYFYGDKELYRFYCMDLAMRGFAVVDFDYRLAPEYRFPAPLEDTNSVLEWVVENREKYNLDIDNVFILGDSAGAQLTNQYACIWSNPSYAKTFGLVVPPVTIRAISLACGVYDMGAWLGAPDQKEIIDRYVGLDFDVNDPRVKLFDYIDDKYPPTFIFSACNDFLRDFCEPMRDFLASRGVDVTSHIYGTSEQKHIAHVFHVDFRYPEGETCRCDQEAFLKKYIVEE